MRGRGIGGKARPTFALVGVNYRVDWSHDKELMRMCSVGRMIRPQGSKGSTGERMPQLLGAHHRGGRRWRVPRGEESSCPLAWQPSLRTEAATPGEHRLSSSLQVRPQSPVLEWAWGRFSHKHNWFLASRKVNLSRVKRLVMDFTMRWKFNLKINHTVTKNVKAI